MLKIVQAGAVLSMALLSAASCQAQKMGDTIGGLGLAYVAPNSSLNSATGSNVAYSSIYSPAGPTATVSPLTALSANLIHMYSDNWAGELSFGIPPSASLNVTVPAAPKVGLPTQYDNAATLDAMTPAILVDYMFQSPGDKFRSYLGFGAEYASFSNISVDNSKTLLNDLASTSASLSSGWFPVYKVGVIYNIDDRWSINASVSYSPVTSNMTLVGPGLGNGANTTNATLVLNPVDYIIRVGYRF